MEVQNLNRNDRNNRVRDLSFGFSRLGSIILGPNAGFESFDFAQNTSVTKLKIQNLTPHFFFCSFWTGLSSRARHRFQA